MHFISCANKIKAKVFTPKYFEIFIKLTVKENACD